MDIKRIVLAVGLWSVSLGAFGVSQSNTEKFHNLFTAQKNVLSAWWNAGKQEKTFVWNGAMKVLTLPALPYLGLKKAIENRFLDTTSLRPMDKKCANMVVKPFEWLAKPYAWAREGYRQSWSRAYNNGAVENARMAYGQECQRCGACDPKTLTNQEKKLVKRASHCDWLLAHTLAIWNSKEFVRDQRSSVLQDLHKSVDSLPSKSYRIDENSMWYINGLI